MTNVMQMAHMGKASDIIRDMRVRSLYSNYYFVKVVLNYAELTDYFHQVEMEGFLDRWSEGCTKQWIEWSRGFFKSTCFTIGTGIWIVLPVTDEDTDYALYKLKIPEELWFQRVKLHNRNARQLLAFETQTNADKKIKEIKWHFEEQELFRATFPEIAYQPSHPYTWTNNCLIIQREGEAARHPEGTFEAIGVGGTLQSRHYDIVWEDDLVGKDATESDVIMQKTIRWHGLMHGAFTDAARQVRFGVSNRWGYNDLNSHIRANEPDFIFHTRSAWSINEETGQETPTFPIDGLGKERFTMEALYKIEHSGSMTPYDFSCQYMNSPRLPGERAANLSAIHRYKVEGGKIKCSCGVECWPESLDRFGHYDPFNAKVTSVSRPAIVTVGTLYDKHIFLLESFTTRGNYDKIYQKLFEMNDRWMWKVFTYEDVGHQNMTEYHIRQMEKNPTHLEMHKKFNRIVGIPPGVRSKADRVAQGLLPLIDHGKFSIRDTHKEFLSQLETFPNKVLDHDYDLLDALNQGATMPWSFPLNEDQLDEYKRGEDEVIKHLGTPYSHMEFYA